MSGEKPPIDLDELFSAKLTREERDELAEEARAKAVESEKDEFDEMDLIALKKFIKADPDINIGQFTKEQLGDENLCRKRLREIVAENKQKKGSEKADLLDVLDERHEFEEYLVDNKLDNKYFDSPIDWASDSVEKIREKIRAAEKKRNKLVNTPGTDEFIERKFEKEEWFKGTFQREGNRLVMEAKIEGKDIKLSVDHNDDEQPVEGLNYVCSLKTYDSGEKKGKPIITRDGFYIVHLEEPLPPGHKTKAEREAEAEKDEFTDITLPDLVKYYRKNKKALNIKKLSVAELEDEDTVKTAIREAKARKEKLEREREADDMDLIRDIEDCREFAQEKGLDIQFEDSENLEEAKRKIRDELKRLEVEVKEAAEKDEFTDMTLPELIKYYRKNKEALGIRGLSMGELENENIVRTAIREAKARLDEQERKREANDVDLLLDIDDCQEYTRDKGLNIQIGDSESLEGAKGRIRAELKRLGEEKREEQEKRERKKTEKYIKEGLFEKKTIPIKDKNIEAWVYSIIGKDKEGRYEKHYVVYHDSKQPSKRGEYKFKPRFFNREGKPSPIRGEDRRDRTIYYVELVDEEPSLGDKRSPPPPPDRGPVPDISGGTKTDTGREKKDTSKDFNQDLENLKKAAKNSGLFEDDFIENIIIENVKAGKYDEAVNLINATFDAAKYSDAEEAKRKKEEIVQIIRDLEAKYEENKKKIEKSKPPEKKQRHIERAERKEFEKILEAKIKLLESLVDKDKVKTIKLLEQDLKELARDQVSREKVLLLMDSLMNSDFGSADIAAGIRIEESSFDQERSLWDQVRERINIISGANLRDRITDQEIEEGGVESREKSSIEKIEDSLRGATFKDEKRKNGIIKRIIFLLQQRYHESDNEAADLIKDSLSSEEDEERVHDLVEDLADELPVRERPKTQKGVDTATYKPRETIKSKEISDEEKRREVNKEVGKFGRDHNIPTDDIESLSLAVFKGYPITAQRILNRIENVIERSSKEPLKTQRENIDNLRRNILPTIPRRREIEPAEFADKNITELEQKMREMTVRFIDSGLDRTELLKLLGEVRFGRVEPTEIKIIFDRIKEKQDPNRNDEAFQDIERMLDRLTELETRK